MLSSLKAKNPKVMIVMTTSVAQAAKGTIDDIPLIYNAIFDPVEAGLIKEEYTSDGNMTGSSDRQDSAVVLKFAQTILPSCHHVGLLYATSESNDAALVTTMRAGAMQNAMTIMAIPVEQSRDISVRMQGFKNAVQMIYVGTSGPIQPALPTIAVEARKMGIPLLNADVQAVKDGLALASFGVDYDTVGKNAGKLAAAVLRGRKISEIKPVYPKAEDHYGVVNKKLAEEFGAKIPENAQVVE